MLDAANRPQIFEYLSKSLNITIYDCKFVIHFNVIYALLCIPDGYHQVYELDSKDLKLLTESEKPSSIKCGTFGASTLTDRHLSTGDFDGKLTGWNLERLESPVFEIQAHDGIVNTVDGCGGDKSGEYCPREVATGGRDGCVNVFDLRQKPTLVASYQPKSSTNKRECWSVAFGNAYNHTERCLLAGYDNGDVKLFDLRQNKVRWENNVRNGVCGVQFDRQDIEMNKFIVTCLESQFHIFDARTQHPEKGFAKHTQESEYKSTCWSGYHLPQDREICSVTHGDGTIALYKYHYPPQRSLKDKDGKEFGVVGEMEQISHYSMSSQPLTCFDWNHDKKGLFICGSLDQQIRIGCITKLNKI
eukprot:g8802.t1